MLLSILLSQICLVSNSRNSHILRLMNLGVMENLNRSTANLSKRWCQVYNGREQVKEWIIDIAQKFRNKGALSPDKDMSPQELGLPPEFQEAMRRRLGQTGIFVETNGKYSLSE